MASGQSPSTEMEEMKIFDMGSLRNTLPQKRGLSKFYSGKARSFTCMEDVKCVEDLNKPEVVPERKRRKFAGRQGLLLPPLSCRKPMANTCSQFCVGV